MKDKKVGQDKSSKPRGGRSERLCEQYLLDGRLESLHHTRPRALVKVVSALKTK